ncbi:hypothetical protein [Rufibacter sp. LB8]|uniref:hypothetical protein n=1 Tax=Rufibacter sp. LB8 TaxID=2777781 RepID=UPI00178C30B7|nr:hypothetical protein [Rufibacter sp. LB8]
MNGTYKTSKRNTCGNGLAQDEFHLLFKDSTWEQMVLFPPSGNTRFFSRCNFEVEGDNAWFNEKQLKPTDVLFCKGEDGKDILIPLEELKIYAYQGLRHRWEIQEVSFFSHTTTGTIYFLESCIDWMNQSEEDDFTQSIADQTLFALPLAGKESKVIKKKFITYFNKRWFKLHGIL